MLSNSFFFLKKLISNKFNEILILILSFIYLLNLTNFSYFKLIFSIQCIIILFFYKKNFKINTSLIPLFILPFIFLIWSQEIKYFIYFLLIFTFSIFFNPLILNKRDYEFNIIFYILFIIFLLLSAQEVNNKYYFFQFIYENILNEIEHSSEFDFFYESFYYRLRYSYFNLDPNYASILILMIYNIFFFKRQRNYLIKYTIFTFFLIYFTQSKSGLLFYLVSLIIYKTNISFNRQVIIFLTFNLIILISSYLFIKNFKNPYYIFENSNKVDKEYIKSYPAQIYSSEVCHNPIFKRVEILTNCKDKKGLIIYGIFGVSSYLKFYSIGIVVDNIFKDFQLYLFPNSFKKFSKNQVNSDYYLNNNLSAHNIILKGIGIMGLIFFVLFLLGIYIFFKRQKNYNFLPAMMASSFVGIDLFLFLPILLISFYKVKE